MRSKKRKLLRPMVAAVAAIAMAPMTRVFLARGVIGAVAVVFRSLACLDAVRALDPIRAVFGRVSGIVFRALSGGDRRRLPCWFGVLRCDDFGLTERNQFGCRLFVLWRVRYRSLAAAAQNGALGLFGFAFGLGGFKFFHCGGIALAGGVEIAAGSG